jgi:hypothetical protein
MIFPELLAVPIIKCSEALTTSKTIQLTKHTPLEFHEVNFPRLIKD